jgi:ubiquinone/menaquinone biosynthesis C-methylase UbiE
MTDDIIEAYNIEHEAESFRNDVSYYRWILKVLAVKKGQNLLDIACGLGDLLLCAEEKGLEAFGLDLSPAAIRTARERAPQSEIVQADGHALPFDENTFDSVTILGSLEHFLRPSEGLLEIRRVLRWGGRVAILVPNSYYLPDIIWNVWRVGRGPDHKQIVQRFATAQEWRIFIEAGGLAVRDIRRFNYRWPHTREDWAWYRANPKRLLHLAAAPFLPFNLSHSFLYVCEKDPVTRGHSFSPPTWPPPPHFAGMES